MFLLTSMNLLLDGRGSDDARRYDGGPSGEAGAPVAFPAGQLTSAAWEGWWHEDAA
ncbi:hypothetical protein QFZ35_002906 [Arthrobacter ulcerisalmonis]|uniref:hypothetical protein n=1 Tax=Arthrobacter sp. B1I2 TaxID=3042263 RepID=UPI00278706D0|nr:MULTISPECIES: hypothetical protein [Arthrobacter]MDQ0664408.1 hypothetical protein [Arthrobacter ulcerisalmonis]MDQ0732318.1 hypothetical protein [Arthrobacter sp. B1I2]